MTNLITTLIITNLLATGHGGKVRERDWQIAANEQHFHGRIEVTMPGGRCDIVTDEYAIEVDPIGKADEAVAQANRYAAALGLRPAIALIVPEGTILTITNAPIRVWLLR